MSAMAERNWVEPNFRVLYTTYPANFISRNIDLPCYAALEIVSVITVIYYGAADATV